jgi:phenylalanyl-tRNA synthetase beta chain
MRLPLLWLREYCDPGVPVGVLTDRLTLAGLELERIEPHGVGSPEGFVVGRVLSAEKHPNADRLSVCEVDVGADAPATIVCGAPNVAAGQTVAVARPGAVMPDGTELGTAKLRGVESHGMILAEDELGIGPDHHGIIVLAGDGDTIGPELTPGSPLAGVLPIRDEVLELETFHNRPDHLGVYGLAREVHAVTGAPLAPAPWSEDPGSDGEVAGVTVEVQCPDLCPRFTARAFENVTLGPSPEWLKARLTAMGQRPISNVVDITNYVMLATGQPLHAFDLGRVAGGRLVVRRAADGEEVQTLDGQTRRCDTEMVIICDDDGPTSIAGVMGGSRSEVETGTTRVLMEVATWNGPNIHRTSTKLGLRSEASSRYEKQLSTRLTMEAQALAAQLMVSLTGATLAEGTIDVGGPGPSPEPVRLRVGRVASVLGREIAPARCGEILTALGFGVSEPEDGVIEAEVPHWRLDVEIEEDLIEEVARIDGLDQLPATLPSRRPGAQLTHAQRTSRAAVDALVGAGLLEIAGWSFTDPGQTERLRLSAGDALANTVRIANPLSEDQSVLRTTLLGSLLDAAALNLSRGAGALNLFEEGAVYALGDSGDSGLPDERRNLAVLLTGTAQPPTWRHDTPAPADVFAAKGVLARVLDTLRVQWTTDAQKVPGTVRASHPFLHPGRSGTILIAGEPVGWLGEIHPLVTEAWDIDVAAAGFELDLGAVIAAAAEVTKYSELTRFPSVRQDLAVVLADDVPAAQVVAVAEEAGGELLVSAEVFDVYRGAQAGEGNVSLALRLEFRAPDRTLTDEDAAERREAIAAALAGELGASQRV